MYIQDRHKQMLYEYKGKHIFFKPIISKVVIYNNCSEKEINKNVDIKFSAHDAPLGKLHQVHSKSEDWKTKSL